MKTNIIRNLIVLSCFACSTGSVIAQTSQSTSVGSVSASFNVSSLGAAVYNIAIDAPTGGTLDPKIVLSYNSQNGYGHAGYGFSLTGIPVITRTSKTLSQDGSVRGVKGQSGDAYSYNGKRMVLISGIDGSDGAVYQPLGNPHIKIILHGNDNSGTNTHFEVHDEQGVVTNYGDSSVSRLEVSVGSNKQTMAWYITNIEDARGNFAVYSYENTNNNVRPIGINYGINKKKSRGISCYIKFQYEELGVAASPFMIGGATGNIDKRLVSITTSTNSSVFRKYTFTYNINSDAGRTKYARLVRVNVSNGSGQNLNPITVDWNYMPSTTVSDRVSDISGSHHVEHSFEEVSRQFMACDLNNDGISDIVRISPTNKYVYYYSSKNYSYNTYTYLNVSLSDRKTGKSKELSMMIPNQNDNEYWQTHITTLSSVDVDGDGYNDIVMPYYNSDKSVHQVAYLVSYGKDLAHGMATWRNVKNIDLYKDCTSPLIATGTFSGNGKNEIFTISNVSSGNNSYPATLLTHKSGNDYTTSTLNFILPEQPKKVYAADYNSDGLIDLIFISDNKYTIFYNQGGGEASVKFSNNNKFTNSTFSNKWRIAQGDFDGDGRLDFVYPTGHDLNIAFNQGNGSFKIASKVATLELCDGKSCLDDDKYTLMAFDQDGDGRSDVFVCNAYYEWHGGFKQKYSFNRGCATWLYSTGSALVNYKQVTIKRSEDLMQNLIFAGDFDGNGIMEVANFGGSLAGTSVSDYEKIRIYNTNSYNMAERGRVRLITDGYGKKTRINYLPGTNVSVYDNSEVAAYPVANCTLPMSLVKSVTVDGGAASSQTTNYSYAGLNVHLRGEGILGFTKTINDNVTLGVKTETTVKKWDSKRFIPTEIETTTTVGKAKDVDRSVNYVTVAELAHNNYFSYVSKQSDTDWNGNDVTTTTIYDVVNCLPIEENVSYDNGSHYKKILYCDYVYKGGMWLPEVVKTICKHADDSQEFIQTTKNTYNDYGENIESIEAYGTPLAFYHRKTYDDFGNVATTSEVGNGVYPVTYYNEYDKSGRFVVKTRNSGTPEVHTYSYDVFGNLLTESDCSNTSKTLTTTYTYDGWGNKLTATDALGNTTEYTSGWGTVSSKKYYTQTTPANDVFVRTWYDVCGNKVLVETVGRCEKAESEAYTYDSKARISKIVTKSGAQTITQNFTYDDHNRILTEISSSGQSVSYSYDNRSVTKTEDGRCWTTERDAWGNIVSATDPMNNDVTYTYRSNGHPETVTANGSVTSFEYDVAGNQIAITDPDAGKTTYTYSADGKIMTQTNARGIMTTNTYDAAKRVTSSTIGSTKISYTYGTSGNGVMQLQKAITNGNILEFTYDSYGRKIKEVRTVAGQGSYTFNYTYNNKNQLTSTTYPNGLVVSYGYDKYGFKTSVNAGQDNVFSMTADDGRQYQYSFKNKLCTSRVFNDKGFMTQSLLHKKDANVVATPITSTTIYDMILTEYNAANQNLISRQRYGQNKETFEYDELDRLTKVYKASALQMEMKYDDNGNITSKTGLGNYVYDSSRPHAVTSVDNTSGLIPSNTLTTSFNEFNKVATIDGGSIGVMNLSYGPDKERWYSQVVKNGQSVRSTVYVGDYEKVIDNGVTREFIYLDGNVIVLKQNGAFTSYLAFTDNQGNILSVVDENGNKKFDAEYDPLGKQTVKTNTIGLTRGYTGHEMLNDFGVINMNGRIYDPVLGRFFSPDEFVQQCNNTQSFNRYSYCINNPLKYVDHSGYIFGIDDAIVFGVIAGAIVGAGEASMNGDKVWAGALIGGVVGGLSAWGGQGLATLWKAGNVGAGVFAGSISGAGISAVSTFTTVGLNNLLNGRNFKEGLWKSVGISALSGGVIGGISGGMKAYQLNKAKGVNPWTGKDESTRVTHDTNTKNCSGILQPDKSKHCYQYALCDVAGQFGYNESPSVFADACGNIDGADTYKLLAGGYETTKPYTGHLLRGGRLMNLPEGTDLVQFVEKFDVGEFRATISLGSDPSAAHTVALRQFDTVSKNKMFGGGTKLVMDKIKVFDPIAGVRNFSGGVLTFDIIKSK